MFRGKREVNFGLFLSKVEEEQAAADKQRVEVGRDRKLLGELEAIRGSRSEHYDAKRTDREYAGAFRAFGIDFDQLDPETAGKQIARRSEPVELASYLEDWAFQRRSTLGKTDEPSWRRLLVAASAADPDPWRLALRQEIGRQDRDILQRLAADEKNIAAQPPRSLALLADALSDQGDHGSAKRVLLEAWRITPDDFWVNFALGYWDGDLSDGLDDGVRYYSVAVAVRPRSAVARTSLGVALAQQGKLDEAIAELRNAVGLMPELAIAHVNLGAVSSQPPREAGRGDR